MKLLHFYDPDHRPYEQLETIQFLDYLNGEDYHIEHIKTIGPLDYETAIKYHWNQGEPFIILEQDKVPTVEILDGMKDCENKICAANYLLNPRKMGVTEWVSAHRIITKGDPGLIKEMKHVTIEEYADLYGFGLTKITPFGRYPWLPKPWRGIDVRVAIYTAKHSYKVHIHPLVVHNHA